MFYDESFVIQASEATLRPRLIRRLRIQRVVNLTFGLICAVIIVLKDLLTKPSEAGVYLALLALAFLLDARYTDGQIKTLRIVGRLSSN